MPRRLAEDSISAIRRALNTFIAVCMVGDGSWRLLDVGRRDRQGVGDAVREFGEVT